VQKYRRYASPIGLLLECNADSKSGWFFEFNIGIDKGRRTKILEKEIQNGSHVKVQGGYGKYQGTWIPFERGVQLARHYRVEELLNPLFTYKSAMGRLDKTPTKEQVMSVNRESKKSKKAREDGHDNLGEQKRKKPKPTKYHNDVSFNDSQLAPHSFELPFYPPSEDLGQPHPSFDLQFAYPQDYSNYYNMPQSSFEHVPVIVENPSERHRSTLISMFMSEDDTAIPDILFPHVNVPDFDIDLILDEHGHTAIHWAAALGRIQILQLLIQKGANINALNFNGETALIRSVMVLHNFDRLTFPQVVNVLRDQLSIPDKKNRNVLHHICLAAAVKTSSQSCRYYMEYLLDFLIRNQKSENENYRDDLFSTINMVDICGDTPLNIAARIGNRFLVDQLLNLGADSTIPNRSGLTPADFNNGTLLEQNNSSIVI
jgi:regulatory protein SWI6